LRGHIRDPPPCPTAGCGKPHVRWCGRDTGRNPRVSTRSWRRSRRHPVKKSLRLCVLCVKKLSTLNSHFGTHKSGERFGVRRQAVFRATPLFEQCFSARGAKGKRCRDPRTARLLSPHSKFSAAPCAAQPLCARAAGNHVNPVKKTSCFSAETHDPRTPLSLTDYLPLTLRMDY